jgi:2-dehydro-3-deoxyphosphogluconate aldolase/(4S)-4-hydroxy-2-oxoglutarate aldolase
MNKTEKLQLIRDTGVIAIMRAKSSDQLMAAADAIRAGGVRVIEVTMTTPGALDLIETAAARFGDDVLFGAGSVPDPETARQAILSGAGFVVAPTLKSATIQLCARYSVPVMPGCLTPTEILTAWEQGADMIKVFPTDFGGPGYIKAVKAPLPQVELIPVGGVTLESTPAFFRAGVSAVGVGSSLINQSLLDEGNMEALTKRAAAFIEAANKGRASTKLT